nr:hypothetical protein [Burkholderia lata]
MSTARAVAFFASSADSGGCWRGGVGAGASASLAGVAEAAEAGVAAEAAEAAEAADALDAPDAGLAGCAGCVCDAAGAGCAAEAPDNACADEAACAREAADAGDSTDEDDVATGDDASDAAQAGRSTSTEIGSAAASEIHAAATRARQRGFAHRRVKLKGIIRSKPSADPAAACCWAGGASSARAIDTSGASCAPGADASSRRSRSLLQRDRSDGG